MTHNQFLESLVCPKTGQPLEVAENGLSLTAPDGTVYPVLDSGIVDMVHPRELFEDDAREQYLYDQAYQRYDRGVSWVFETLNHSDETATRQFMIGLMDLKPGQTVLEVGAGTGKDSALIIDQISPEGTAISLALESIQNAAAEDAFSEDDGTNGIYQFLRRHFF